MSDKASSLTSDQIDELLLSARYGDLEDLQTTLSTNTSAELLLSIKNEDSNTLLHYASANGHLNLVQYLLPYSNLAYLLSQNISGNTALHWAALNGHLDVVKALIVAIEKLEKANPEEAKKLNLILHPKSTSLSSSSQQSSADPENANVDVDKKRMEEEDDGSERKLWDVRNTAGRGPMSEAQMREQEAVVKYLLERMIEGPEGSSLQPAEPLPTKLSTQALQDKTANLSLDN
ncbi:uncharacterized protein MEPE_06078 [Melanopsichium pennsylvanicum]|uniref:Ankyrin n=1 Tax=Melanopsichium pennsylvanicum TaxID=63383 RepID=A0AAJ4XU13_9BASI|nr:uncharacterized protein MEPE_06078 [Melanopsichium pennsylvanicum]